MQVNINITWMKSNFIFYNQHISMNIIKMIGTNCTLFILSCSFRANIQHITNTFFFLTSRTGKEIKEIGKTDTYTKQV